MAQGVPLIAQETNSNQAARAKKKELPGNDGKTSFTAILEKTGKDGHFLNQNTIKGNNGGTRLLKLISQIVKKINNKLPGPVKDNFSTLVRNIVRQKGFSEKEKADLLKTLLQKIQKKNTFPGSLADDILAMSSSLNKNIRDASLKNRLISGIQGLMDEKSNKGRIQPHDGASKLVVIDLRKGNDLKEQVHTQEKSLKGSGNGENGGNTINTHKPGAQEGITDNTLYFTLKDGLTSQENSQGISGKGHGGIDQQTMEKLKSSLENEIVKHTKIILKENGNGEIRIVLKPESLGSIRIRVNVENNHIDGRIFVENNNIKEIVDQAVNDLNAAFKEEGFDTISLKVSVGNENKQDEKENRQQGPSGYTYAAAVEEFGKNLELLFDVGIDYSRVNLFI